MKPWFLLPLVTLVVFACTHDPQAGDYFREESNAEVIFSQVYLADSTGKEEKSTQKGRLYSKAENDSAFTVIYLYNLERPESHTYTKLEFSLNLEKPGNAYPVKWSMFESKDDQPGEVIREESGQVKIEDSLIVLSPRKPQVIYKLNVSFPGGKDISAQNIDAYWNPKFGILIYDGEDSYSELAEYRDISYVSAIEYLKDKIKNRFLKDRKRLSH